MRYGSTLMSLKAHSHCTIFFSDCECDSSYCNKWVVQESMKAFTLTTSPTPMQPVVRKNKSQSQSEKIIQCEQVLKVHSHCVFFSDCDCDLFSLIMG